MSIKLLKSIFRSILSFLGGRMIILMALALGLFGAPFAAQAQFFIDLEIEQGTYRPGDPVSMMATVTNTSPTVTCGLVVVQVTLSQDATFGTEDDHNLTRLSGPSLAPGQSYTWQWVQRIPGNIPGTFFVHARAHTITTADCTGVVSPFELEDAKITIPAEDHPETSLVSVGETGLLSDSLSETPSISQDGRWVAFASQASTLLGGFVQQEEDEEPVFVGLDNNGLSDIYIRDQWTGEVERVTWPASGGDPNGPSHLPRLSADADARWVAYHSSASNMTTTQDNNGVFDVFLFDRETDETTLVSRALDGRPGNGVSQGASVSSDGRWVAFESEASNLVSGDTNQQFDIFVADVTDGKIRRVNVTDFGVQAAGGQSRGARISADGRHIVFESRATNLAPGGNPGLWEVYVHDRDVSEDGDFDEPGDIATIRLSVDYDLAGNPIFSDGHSFEASLSTDGRFVTFVSEATTLFSEPATGSIIFTGKPGETTILFEESVPAGGTIGFQPDVPATGLLGFAANPAGGHTVQISDGTTNRTFEFAELGWTVAPGNVRVFIGANPEATRNNLVTAINNAFLIDEEQTMWAEAVSENGNPAIRLTNLVNGEAGNQPISDGGAPTLEIAGMSGAVVDQPAPGDSLVIDNNRTGPVTIEFFAAGSADPTDHAARILGVELGRTAKETSLNMLAVFHGLGYDEYDLPEVPESLLSPLAENPQPGESFLLSRGDEDEGTLVEVVFTFVENGPQFDPLNPTNVLIAETPAETRGNLMRAIALLFTFDPLPAIIEGTGQQFAISATLSDSPAEGSISLNVVPPENATLTLDDGFGGELFRFVPMREQTEEEAALGIPVPPFERAGGEIHVFLTDGMTVGDATLTLFNAIQASLLDLTARLAGNTILLVNNQVGPVGNVPIVITPVPTEEELAEGTLPWANVAGMDGGSFSDAIGEGSRIVFYPENLLHPSVVFEFREDLQDLSADAHFGVLLGSTPAETEGNFLAVLSQSGLPYLIAEDPFAPEEDEEPVEGELTDPQIRLISEIGAAGGDIEFTYSPSDPTDFAVLTSSEGETRAPSPGGTLTVDDGVNTPVVFEFSGDGTARDENIPVLITGSTETIRDNLIDAINETEDLNVEAKALTGDEIGVRIIRTISGPITATLVEGRDLGPWVDLVNEFGGQWNPIEGEGFILNDGISGPAVFEFVSSADDISEPDWIPVIIGDDRYETRDNLIEAIKDSDLNIEAVATSDGTNPGVLLTHFSTGAIGNQAIISLTEEPSFEIEGMAGGGSLASGIEQVYLVDRDSDENGHYDERGRVSLELISVSPLGTGGNHISREPVVSADGRFVAFRSQADNLLPLTVTRSDGEVFTNYVDPQPLGLAIVDGEIIELGIDLSSEISRLTDIDTFPNIYLYDRAEGTHRRVDVNRFGESMLASSMYEIVGGSPRSSRHPTISADGRYIAFESEDEPFGALGLIEAGGGLWHGATNRDPLDFNDNRDVYIHDQRFPSSGPEFEGTVVVNDPGVSISVGTGLPLRATVSDLEAGRTVLEVSFYANGQLIGTANEPIAPTGIVGAGTRFYDFSVTWTPILEDEYRITAVATDSRGRELPVSDAVDISVEQAVANPPSISIVAPIEIGDGQGVLLGQVISNQSSTPFVAQVIGGNATIDRVAFYLRGYYVGDASRESGAGVWRLSYDLSNFVGGRPAAPGIYDLSAVAWDANGNSASFGGVDFIVTTPLQTEGLAPELAVSDNDIARGQSVLLTLSANNNGTSLVSANFYSNGDLIGIIPPDAANDGRFLQLQWTPQYTGTHHIYATAVDSEGFTVVSDPPVVLEVEAVADVGSVEIVSPADGEGAYWPSFVGDIATGAPPIPVRVDFDLPEGVSYVDVTILANGVPVPVEDLTARGLTGSSVWLDWNARVVGEYALSAVVTDTRGNTWQSESVTVTILPLGVVPGNPASPVDNEAFVAQTIWDLLGRPPSQSELQRYVGQLDAETLTRGELVAALTRSSNFEIIRWVVATYLTVLGDYPTVEQLLEGISILASVEVDAESGLLLLTPENFAVLIDVILGSADFESRHGFPGLRLALPENYESFLDVIWEDNLNREWRDFDVRQEQLNLLIDLGHDQYLLELVGGSPEAEATVLSIVAEEGVIVEENGRILEGALILTLLNRAVLPGDIAQLSGSVAAMAQQIVSSYQYANRFDLDLPNFFGLEDLSLSTKKVSEIFGTFDDKYFDYFAGEGWIDHKEHGWLYVDGEGYPNGMWVWDHIQQEWLWTRIGDEIYPFFFSDDAQDWRFYFEGGKPSERHFFFYELDEWETIKP